MSELLERIDRLGRYHAEHDGPFSDIVSLLQDCKAALSQQEAEPVAYLWGGVLIRADETHPCHRREGAPLYRHQPKSLDQSPVAYSWDDNNGFGGSPSRRVEFEYPQYFHGPVTKLYDHASPIDVKTIMAELRAHCESNNELVPEQSIDDTLLSTEKMMGREAPKPAAHPIEPSPQGLEGFIESKRWNAMGFAEYRDVITVSDLRAYMAGKELVPVEFINVLDNAPYINPSNYDHDQVCALNAAVREALAMLAASKEGA